MHFLYGKKEIEYLKSKDAKLAVAIDKIGQLATPVIDDLFTAVVFNIVGQQISTAALDTVWGRIKDKLETIDAPSLLALPKEELQSCGLSYRKVDYILDFARKVQAKEYVLADVQQMTDEEVIESLSSLKGIGRWTAEMLMIFSLQRPNVVSFDDLGIRRGMRMLYRHREIDRKKFDRYRRRYAPYGTVASLYLWAIANGAIEGLTDPERKKSSQSSRASAKKKAKD